MSNPLEKAKDLLTRASKYISINTDTELAEEVSAFLRSAEEKEDADLRKYLVTTENDGRETVFHGDGCLIVPIETLDAARKKQLYSLEYEKVLKHGGELPGVFLSEIFEELDSVGMLKPIIDSCRKTRKRLDDSE